MKILIAIFGLLTISLTAMAEGKLATVGDIKAMSTILAAGTYKGQTPKGSECTVTVIDNNGDGTGYSINIAPTTYDTPNLKVAYVVITPGLNIVPRLQVKAYEVLGTNFISFFKVDESNGKKTVTVNNQIDNNQVVGICTIN